jgi:hypothetical protein
MYDHTNQRFGWAITVAAIFAWAVLVSTGLAEIIPYLKIDWSPQFKSGIVFIVAGFAVLVGLKLVWSYAEKRLKP